MFCENCGQEVNGKFCSNCGQPLPTINDNSTGDTKEWNSKVPVEDTEELRFSQVDQAVHRRSQNSHDSEIRKDKANQQQTVVKNITEKPSSSRPGRSKTKTKYKAKAKGFRGFSLSSLAGSGISTILRYISLGLMVVLTLYTAAGFWNEKNALGNIFQMVKESNYAMYVYSGLAAVILFFGCISCLWIYSRRKMADGKRMKRYDTGRGLVPFLFFGLLTFFAKILIVRIPGSPDYLRGITSILQVFFVHKSINLTLCLGGIVCSVLRGIKFH